VPVVPPSPAPQEPAPPPPPVPTASKIPELPPPPIATHAQHSRHSVELIPELGIGIPECSDGDLNNARCNGMKGGIGIGFEALWRVSPYFAFGADLMLHGFTFEPKRELGLKDASAGAVFLGLVARGYFLSTGPLDPYAELALGVGALGTQAKEADGNTYSETAAGPGGRLAVGIDFYLGRHLRLGPALGYGHFFVDKVRRCDDDRDCSDLSSSKFGHLNGFWTISGRLSILLGEPM
jgi:hypothetical protein